MSQNADLSRTLESLPEPELASPPGFRSPPQYPHAERNPDSPESPPPAPDATAADGSGGPAAEAAGPARSRSTPSLKGKGYEKLARGAIRAVGGLLNMALAADEQDDSFLPDDEDQALIAAPLGRTIARKIPAGDGREVSELEDLGLIVVGLVSYGIKGVVGWLDARRSRNPKLPAGTVVSPEDTNPDAQGM